MFRKLLVPLDGAALAEQAIGRAAAIARAAHAEIDLTIVHTPVAFDGFADAPWSATDWRAKHAYVETVAAEIVAGASVAVTHSVLTGDPVEMICQRAADIDADLIVMSSHSRRGLARFWLGSITDGIVRHASIPVLVLHPDDTKTRHDAAHHLPTHILVSVDEAPGSTATLAPAVALAQCANARLSLLRVIEAAPVVTVPATIPIAWSAAIRDEQQTEQMVADAKQQLDHLASVLHEESAVVVETQAVVGDGIAPTILEFSRSNAIDTIAMIKHGPGAARHLLGSTTAAVLRRSGLPTLVLPWAP